MVHNCHKQVLSIMFQNLALPNGILGNISNSFEGKQHNSTMLHES